VLVAPREAPAGSLPNLAVECSLWVADMETAQFLTKWVSQQARWS
jgi:hypothetical protein